MSIFTENYKSPIGNVIIKADEEKLISIQFSDEDCEENANKITGKYKKLISEYFNRAIIKCTEFEEYAKSDFQHSVIRQIIEIPYGETRTYSEISEMSGYPKSQRAVAGVCSKNPFLLVIPCHRVVSANKKDMKYKGGEYRKRWLLSFES